VLSVLSGCIGSPPVALDRIAWESQRLLLKNCPNIDGTYVDRGELIRTIFAPPIYPEGLFHQRQQMQIFKDVPYPEFGRGKNVSAEVDAIDSKLISSIKIDAAVAMVSLMNKSGERYRTKTVRLAASVNPSDHLYGAEWFVGCDQGDFVERSISSGGGADFTPRTVTAKEKRIRRLSNGDLRIHRKTRYWINGKGDEPFTDEETKVFPLYRGTP